MGEKVEKVDKRNEKNPCLTLSPDLFPDETIPERPKKARLDFFFQRLPGLPGWLYISKKEKDRK